PRLGTRSERSVDHDARTAERDVVQFTRGGLKRSNRIDVRSFAKHVAVEERGLRGGAGAEDIGFGGAGTRVDRFHFHTEFGLHLLSEVLGADGVFASDQSTLEVANVAENVKMGSGLAAGSEHPENTGDRRARQ